MSAHCGMDPAREQLADIELRNSSARKYDGRSKERDRLGHYDYLQIRVAHLEARMAEMDLVIQALIDRRAS